MFKILQDKLMKDTELNEPFSNLEIRMTAQEAGENPYRYIAWRLDQETDGKYRLLEKMDRKISKFQEGRDDPGAYQKLIDWEVKNFKAVYEKAYGQPPQEGSLEDLLPDSRLTDDAKEAVEKLKERGIRPIIVSSGFKVLAMRAAEELGIPEEDVWANSFVYDEESGELAGIEVVVSGNKTKVLAKILAQLAEEAILPDKVAVTEDNRWGEKWMGEILEKGGYVIYKGRDEESKSFPLSKEEQARFFGDNRFIRVEKLRDILENDQLLANIKVILLDLDGTLIKVAEGNGV